MNNPRSFYSVNAGQPDVHQDDIRRVLPRELDRLLPILGFCDDFKTGLIFYQPGYPVSEKRMVINQQHSNRRFLILPGTFGGQNGLRRNHKKEQPVTFLDYRLILTRGGDAGV
jgi:hypothetical protein